MNMTDSTASEVATTTTADVVVTQPAITTIAATQGTITTTTPSHVQATAAPSQTASESMMAVIQAAVLAANAPLMQRITMLEAAARAPSVPVTMAPATQHNTLPPGPPATPAPTTSTAAAAAVPPPSDDVTEAVRRELRQMGMLEGSDASQTSSSDDSSSDEERQKRKKGKKIKKSGRVRTAVDGIQNSAIDWPHFAVYKGEACKAAEYDELTVPEFVYGYIDILKNGDLTDATKEKMLDHLQDLMEDASSYPWKSVRNFHGVLLSEMERNRLTWRQEAKIQRLRMKYAHRQDSGLSVANTVPCELFNEGRYDKSSDHDGLFHVCSHCHETRQIIRAHPAGKCYIKNGKAKKPAGAPKPKPDSGQ